MEEGAAAAQVCREALPSLADSSARLAAAIQDSHSAQSTGEWHAGGVVSVRDFS
jgi:hypothetical protein